MILITIPDGRLCADPRINDLPSGGKVANLRIATNYRTKDGDEWVQEAKFFDVEIWRGADTIAQYFTKGSPIVVWGELQDRTWTDQQGQQRTSEIVKNASWTFPPKNDGTTAEQPQAGAPRQQGYAQPAQQRQAQYQQPAPAPANDDIPW